jgi:hypothetical protein
MPEDYAHSKCCDNLIHVLDPVYVHNILKSESTVSELMSEATW